ncbi:hypothetical protein N4Q46_21450 [Salmonella enterica subsp. enterica serovar Minnesota]
MKTELTLNVLQTMSVQEYEDIRAAGSDERRELTHAVMRELDAQGYSVNDIIHILIAEGGHA